MAYLIYETHNRYRFVPRFVAVIFTVGSKRPPVQEINQRSVGAVYLFKSELDSNNAPPAATEVLARPNGRQLLTIEKYELYDEMNRLRRLIAKEADYPHPYRYHIDDYAAREAQFDYQKKNDLHHSKIADSRFIVDIAE